MATTPTNPYAGLSPDTPVQQDAVAGQPFLLLWVDPLRIHAPFVDSASGLAEAKRTLVEQWNTVRAPLHTPVSTIAALERLFVIRRIRPGRPDELVCTLHQAIRDIDPWPSHP